MTRPAYIIVTAGAALGTVALFFSVRYLPSIDLPQHAAQVAVLRGGPMRELFEVNWLTPYALGYVPAHALAAAVSPRVAVSLVLLVAVLAVPAATLLLARNPWWAFVGFPAGLGFAFHQGFYSCAVASPLLLLLVWAMHRNLESGRGAWQVAALALLLAWAHALVAAFALAVAGAMALVSKQPRRIGALVPAALLLAAWWASDTAPAGPTVFGDTVVRRLAHLPALAAGGDPPAASFALAIGMAAVLLLTGRPARDPARWIPLALTCVAILLLPRDLAGGGYLYPRFGIFVLPLLVFALEPRKGPAPAAALLPVLALGWLAFTFDRWRAYDEETRALPELFATMEPGRLLLYLPLDPRSARSALPLHRGSGGWYAAERGGWSELSLARVPFMPVRYRAGRGVPLPVDFFREMEGIAGVEPFDYVLVRGRALERTDLRLLRTDEPWRLYAVETPAASTVRGR